MHLNYSTDGILNAFCPENTVRWIRELNPSKDAPYHNSTHESLVVNFCYEGLTREWVNKKDNKFDEAMSSLLLAAAFHDFDHTAGKEKDSVNIKRACAGLEKAMLGVSESIRKNAIKLIKVTEYPYVVDPKSIAEKIIRDADLMMMYAPEDIRLLLFKGLKEELATSGMKFTDKEYSAGLLVFYDNIKWHTVWAKEKARELDFGAQVRALAKSLIPKKK